jgi:hypothetical protein
MGKIRVVGASRSKHTELQANDVVVGFDQVADGRYPTTGRRRARTYWSSIARFLVENSNLSNTPELSRVPPILFTIGLCKKCAMATCDRASTFEARADGDQAAKCKE